MYYMRADSASSNAAGRRGCAELQVAIARLEQEQDIDVVAGRHKEAACTTVGGLQNGQKASDFDARYTILGLNLEKF